MTLPALSIDRAPRPLRRRILIAAPAGGLGRQLAVMQAWLDTACGPAGWASAPAGSGGVRNDAIAFYFADDADADAFVARFCCGYQPADL